VAFGVGRLHDGITADPSCLFLYSLHTAGSSTVYVGVVLVSLVRRVVPCANPNL